jgi:hypothetical protein
MQLGDWIAGLALALGVVNAWRAFVRSRREDTRLDTAEQRLAAQDDALLLNEIRARLEQLYDAALARLDSGGATRSRLTALIGEATYWAERSKWTDVRDEAMVLVKVAGIAREVEENDPTAHKDATREALFGAMHDARKAIGDRVDEVRETGRTR